MLNFIKKFINDNKKIIYQFIKFLIVGISATVIYVVVAVVCVEILSTNSVFANCLSYPISTTFAYIFHTKWSFESNITKRNLFKFFIVAIICLVIIAIIASIFEHIKFPYQLGIAANVVTVPILSFFMNKLWTYKKVD